MDLELDNEPRQVSVPEDLARALEQDAGARQFFAGRSYSNQRRIVLSIEEAKTPETRQKRITKALSNLQARKI